MKSFLNMAMHFLQDKQKFGPERLGAELVWGRIDLIPIKLLRANAPEKQAWLAGNAFFTR
jgi:hypothetical protein